MPQSAVILASFIFVLSAAVALLVTILPLYYQARALKLEASKQKQKLAKEMGRGIYQRLIPATISAVILAGLLLIWFYFSLLPASKG